LMAPPPDMSILSAATQFFSEPAMAFTVPPGVFIPPPRVDSAVISLRAIKPNLDRSHWPLFFRIVHAGFGQKRKNLANSLSHGLDIEKPVTETWLRKNEIDPMRRAETLSVKDWVNLTKSSGGFVQ
jgi:16S rRNA (adenine1518-N6/adenine1519-N6)-dimethyltransferase